jgi:integrase
LLADLARTPALRFSSGGSFRPSRRIRPLLTEKKAVWKGLCAGRRTAATVLTQLTGNPIAASQLLRHRNMSVTMTAYVKADRKALTEGLRLMESTAKNRPTEGQ